MRRSCLVSATAATMLLMSALPASAADPTFNAAQLSAWFAAPFAALLLSIAVMPLVIPHVWHHHFGKITAFWALAFLVPFALTYGWHTAGDSLAHTALTDYLPFVILLVALFTVAGGILVTGNLHGSPVTNLVLIGIGTGLASLIGTTGASMVLIRPLLRANDDRLHNAHVVIFFIFLVSNVGGSLTPLGDPPLFLGYLQGVGFFWTLTHMLDETALVVVILMAVFFVIDRHFYHRDEAFKAQADPSPDTRSYGIEGKRNIALMVVIVAIVLACGSWKPGIDVTILGIAIGLQDLTRDVALIAVALVSLATTPQTLRAGNGFTWGPMAEVAKIFAGIFVTLIPVILMLRAGRDGPFGGLLALVTHGDGTPNNAMYFWLTGILSSFLDNAPTYLVFFNLAGGNAEQLMTSGAATLLAISCGAVFMGANSYIGNAPNFMVKAIAEENGVKMPGFFGYMAWSCTILLPTFAIVTWVYFR